MEVHHHSHKHRKKISGHLWDFVMMFVAVFCGFWAENIREHWSEHSREKKYISSVITDLTADTAWMKNYLNDQWASIQAFDSVVLLLKNGNADPFSQRRIYYLARMAIKMSSPNKINFGAYDQIRNSGNLRLIKKQATIDSIFRYYFSARDIEQLNETIMQRQSALVEFEGKIFDGIELQNMEDLENFQFKEPAGNPKLITTDKTLINDFIVRIHFLVSANALSRKYAANQKNAATNLIKYLKNEYHLQ